MELYLVRHGETRSNTGEDDSCDSVLTEKGIMQAEYLGKYLENIHFDKIYSSHLIRAVQTAAAVAKYQQGEPEIIVVPELAERGITSEFVPDKERLEKAYSKLVYADDLINKDFHGDIERSENVLRRLVFDPAYLNTSETKIKGENEIRYNPEKILIVAHGGLNACILSNLVNFRFDINMNVVQHNTCINRFRLFLFNGVRRIAFEGYNETNHLPEEIRQHCNY